MEAVRYTEGAEIGALRKGKNKSGQDKQKKSTDGGKIWKMAWSNLARSKGRTVVVILSLSLAIILLNSVFTVTSSFDMDTYLKHFVTTDYQIANAKCFGLDHYYGADEGEVQTEKLSESFISECEAQDGFEAGGRIYSSTRFGLEASSWKAPKDILHDEKGYYWTFGSMKQYYDVDEKGAYSSDTVVYGLEDFPLEQIEVYEGEKDLKVIKEKLASGKSVIKENYYALTNRYSIMFCYYTTADIFKEMESEDFLMSYLMNVEDQKEKSYGQFVENYTTTTEPLMDYESKQKYIDEFAGMKNLFILVGGTLSIVIGLIGILNFINSVLTNVVTRRKEFAMMEAIGMTKKQLLRMLILEGLYYAGITILAVLVFGSLFSFTVVRVLSGGIWFMKYRFVIWPMLAACPFLILFGIVVPYLAYAPQRKNSLVEEIRKNE